MTSFLICLLAITTPLPLWQDVSATSVSAETRRTEVIYYPTREEALSKGFEDSCNYLSLNGEWDFVYYDDQRSIPPIEQWSSLPWGRIQVPGNWEVQGHGTALYVNHPYEFQPYNPQPPQLPEVVPAGCYRRSFNVPAAWKGRAVYLNIGGVKSGCYVYVNGQEAGYCEDSKSLARFPLSDYLKEGDNELLLKVYRFSTGSYLECQDFWRISGIERDVYLSSEKEDTGFDFSLVSTLDPSLENGLLRLQLRSHRPVEVAYELIDKDGTVLADARYSVNGERTTVTDTLPGVRRWSAETPELYTLLLQVDGEFTRFPVGFRRIEIAPVKDGERTVKALLVNGQPVKFKGVNLHEHNPYTGHYLTRENILEDLRLMKAANINGIRTCHYPQPRAFYDLCDSLGFYVYDEANIESHGMGYRPERTLAAKPEWYAKHIDRILNMYYRTANHPSVTILSLGNEAGNGINFQDAYKVLKALEADGMNRPVCYERAEFEWNTDMIVPQYPGADWFRWMGENYKDRPVCPSEYAHAMGNSTGGLDRQWDAIYAHTHLQGGFIWDWVDQGLYDAERGWTYGGDYGENSPSDGNFLCNGIVNPDRDPHPGYYEVKHVYQDIDIQPIDAQNGLFRVFNRFYFKDLQDYTLQWTLERDGRRVRRGKVHLSTAPQCADTLHLRLPKMRRKGQYRILFETVTRSAGALLPKGTIVAMDQTLVKDNRVRKAYTPSGAVPTFVDGDAEVRVSGKNLTLVFDKLTGSVKTYQVKGHDVVAPGFGLQPLFWRAPTDNDFGNNEPYRTRAWKNAVQAVRTTTQIEADRLVITAVYTLPEGAQMTSRFLVYPSGILRVETAFQGGKTRGTELPRLGYRMRVADDAFTYYGRGPVENYCDRFSGTAVRRFTSSAEAEYYPYVRPQETGHHTGTEWLQIGGLTVVADSTFEFNALRQSVEDLDSEDAASRPYQWQNFIPGEPHPADSTVAFQLRRQTHLCDVPVRDYTELCIDYRMTGIGGYDSWGSLPEEDCMLRTRDSYAYAFTLVPAASLRPRKALRYSYE